MVEQLTAQAKAQARGEGYKMQGSASITQRRLWFLDRLQTARIPFNTVMAFRIAGSLQPAAFEEALTAMVQRHHILRTTFKQDGILTQQVETAPPADLLDYVDLSEFPSETAAKLLSEETQRRFDLEKDPPFAAKLIKLSADEHLLIVTAHQAVLSEFVYKPFIQELLHYYDTCLQNAAPDAAPPAMQYIEYVQQQEKFLQNQAAKELLEWWREWLRGITPVLDLPQSFPRPAAQSLRGRVLPFALSAGLSEKLSAHEDPFTLLLAAFTTLLYRYTGQEELLVGVPAHHHEPSNVRSLIGPFYEMLIVRASIRPDAPFAELFDQTRLNFQQAWEHRQMPFETLIDRLQPDRDLSREALIQAAFSYDTLEEMVSAAGLRVTRLPVEVKNTTLDLQFHLWNDSGIVTGELVYSQDLYDPEAARRMITHFQNLLEGIVHDPQAKLYELPLLSEDERHRLVVEWNQTEKDYPKEFCFHELFERQAEKTPDRIAAAFADQRVSYAELNRRANRLAHHLLHAGLEAEQVVAIMARRSIDFLTGMIAIFKAGGAYMPIDPRNPPQRIHHLLKQSQTRYVLADDEFIPILEQTLAEHPLEIVPPIMSLAAQIAKAAPEANPALDIDPDRLAYVIFTSGSTGLPKGAMVEHRGMLNHLYAKVFDLDLHETDAVAQNAPQSFDISVWQFLVALLLGARVHIFDDDIAQSPKVLLEQVAQHQVTVLEVVPSIMRIMIDAVADSSGSPLQLPALRWLIPTGEALAPELARQWLKRYPHIPLVNAYGPTECSDDVTHYPVHKPPAENVINMPIGRPIPNMQMYILDPYLQPVPVGVKGELYVGGIGVGRGYLNDLERTAQAFLDDPFSGRPGARLYRTGDLGRYLPDGNIEFLGRVDFQVKINGQRIELNEIQVALEKHPNVRESVIKTAKRASGSDYLVAYLVPQEQPAPSVAELRDFLKEQLPVYMVPSYFMVMDAFPLTPNGKIDRKALPEPEIEALPGGEFVAPRTPVEQQLGEVWAKILGLEQVDIHANFFDMGGNSLLAIRLFVQIEKLFGVSLPLAVIFQAPTIEQLAHLIENKQSGDAESFDCLVKIQEGSPDKPKFFCVHAHGGHVLYYYNLSRYLGDDQPFYALQALGVDGKKPPLTRFEEMAAKYVEEIQAVQPQGPYYLAGHCLGGVLVYEVAQQIKAQGHKVALLAMFDAYRPGYPHLARFVTPRLYNFLRVAQRLLFYHGGNLLRMSGSDRRQYVNRLIERLRYTIGETYDRLRARLRGEAVGGVNPLLQIQDVLAAAEAAYQPKPYEGDVTLFTCSIPYPGIQHDPTLGWGEMVKGNIELHIIPGYFDTMILEPDVKNLAAELKKVLTQAYQKTGHKSAV